MDYLGTLSEVVLFMETIVSTIINGIINSHLGNHFTKLQLKPITTLFNRSNEMFLRENTFRNSNALFLNKKILLDVYYALVYN